MEFASPPDEPFLPAARSVEYFDFAIGIDLVDADFYEARVTSPAGQGRNRFRLPSEASDPGDLLANLVCAVRGTPAGEAGGPRDISTPGRSSAALDPRALGEALFRALFAGRVLELFYESLGLVRGKGLRLRLHLDPTRTAVAKLCAVPWELLWPEGRLPLCLSATTPVVRYLEVARPVLPIDLNGPLRILVVISSPEGCRPIDVEGERRRIDDSWGRQDGVEIEYLEAPSLRRLCDALQARPRHVMHFIGHGAFHEEKDEGALVFETAEQFPDVVPGELLAAHLHLPAPPILIVLNACDSARQSAKDGRDPFAGVAAALVHGGLMAVVAMQFPISDGAAVAFSGGLYHRLATGSSLEEAVTAGRLAIQEWRRSSLEWITPSLFLRTERALEVPFTVPRAIAEQVRDVSSYIAEKTSGFVGRRFVFKAIDDFTTEQPRGYYFIRGDPGIGKTALLARMVEQHGCVHHFNIRSRNVCGAADFLRNVCARLIAAYRLDHGSLPPEATRDSGFLDTLLEEVSQRLQPGKKAMILVDALDESERLGLAEDANTLCLPESLPRGIYIVATTRMQGETKLPLHIACEQGTLFLDNSGVENLADIEELVANHLADAGIQSYIAALHLDEKSFIAQMLELSEGNFMYLHWVLPEIARGCYTDGTFRQLPKGLTSYYQQHWRRMRLKDEDAWLRYRLPVIMALTVVREPVSFDLLAELSGVEDRRRVRLALDDLMQFLHEEKVPEAGQEEVRYRLYHMSFFEFVKSKDEVEVSFKEAYRRVVQVLSKYL